MKRKNLIGIALAQVVLAIAVASALSISVASYYHHTRTTQNKVIANSLVPDNVKTSIMNNHQNDLDVGIPEELADNSPQSANLTGALDVAGSGIAGVAVGPVSGTFSSISSNGVTVNSLTSINNGSVNSSSGGTTPSGTPIISVGNAKIKPNINFTCGFSGKNIGFSQPMTSGVNTCDQGGILNVFAGGVKKLTPIYSADGFPATGYSIGWSGDCVGNSPICVSPSSISLSLSNNKTRSATATLKDLSTGDVTVTTVNAYVTSCGEHNYVSGVNLLCP